MRAGTIIDIYTLGFLRRASRSVKKYANLQRRRMQMRQQKNDNNLHRRVVSYYARVYVLFSNKPPQQKKRTQHVSKLLHKRTSISFVPTRIVRRFTTSTRIKDHGTRRSSTRLQTSGNSINTPCSRLTFRQLTTRLSAHPAISCVRASVIRSLRLLSHRIFSHRSSHAQ